MVTAMDTFNWMKEHFNKEACEAFTKPVNFEYHIDGEGGGVWHIALDGKGNYELVDGEAEKAVVTYSFGNAEDFYKISTGEIDGIQAYMQGLVKVKGPVGLAQKFELVFKA